MTLVVKKRQKVTAWPPETLVTSDFRKLFLVKQSHVWSLSGPRRGTFSLLGHLRVILGVVLTPNATKLTAVANELTGQEIGPSLSDYLLFNYRWLSDLGQ